MLTLSYTLICSLVNCSFLNFLPFLDGTSMYSLYVRSVFLVGPFLGVRPSVDLTPSRSSWWPTLSLTNIVFRFLRTSPHLIESIPECQVTILKSKVRLSFPNLWKRVSTLYWTDWIFFFSTDDTTFIWLPRFSLPFFTSTSDTVTDTLYYHRIRFHHSSQSKTYKVRLPVRLSWMVNIHPTLSILSQFL